MYFSTRRFSFFTAAVALLLTSAMISGCSDSSSSTSKTTLTGSVFASAVEGGSCEVMSADGSSLADAVSTAADGSFSVKVADAKLKNDLRVVCSGGTYTDEATGTAGVSAGELAVYVAGGSLGADSSNVHITPQSTVVHALVVTHGKTLAEAQTAFNTAFNFTPDHGVAPTSSVSPAEGASTDSLLDGLHAAAFSQLTADLGLATGDQFALLAALAQDLSDDVLDGVDAAGAVTVAGTTVALAADIQNRFTMAMLNFRSGGNDNSGLANNAIGVLPFGKVAYTDTYKVEYVPGMMDAMQGKTQFKIKLSSLSDGSAVSGQTVMLMPMMNMAEHKHSTPVEGCADNSDGTYSCTLYYLMASAMMDGTSMGYWDLEVMIGMMNPEKAHFFPNVMMAMGDSVRATLKGQADMIAGMAMDGGMAMPENRSYYLFKSDLSTGMTSGHDFQMFIAAKESMMSYPAVTGSTILSEADAMYELVINAMTVEVSTDATTWAAASDDGNGYWGISDIPGLMDGMQSEIYVRVTVNSEQKTTDGGAVDGTNDYATFIVTPGGSMSMM